VSARGNQSVLRNEKWAHRQITGVKALSEWAMPEYDILEFDYSSRRRPPGGPLDQLDGQTLSNMMMTLELSECPDKDQLTALRMVSAEIWISSMQLRAFTGIYETAETQVEMVIIFYLRVLDMHNEKLFRVKFTDEAFVFQLRERLGYITTFPFIQPEQSRFDLDFAQHDQRIVANILMNIAKQEDPYFLREPVWIHENGKTDPLTQGIPRTWDNMDKLPKGGSFKVKYTGAPDNRNWALRKSMMELYGGWHIHVEYEDVLWWSAVSEAPEDVLEYLEFLICKFPTLEDAFLEIDGEGGNGVVSCREFEESYADMGCLKFEGPDCAKRVEAVYRWLDPNENGQVSCVEFMILEQLFKEIMLSIREFVEFCERHFGEDLEDTWNFLDEDGGGEVDIVEWLEGCQKIGYRGPVTAIFGFMDKDDEGTVSVDEFQELEQFTKKYRLEQEANQSEAASTDS